MIAKIRFNLSEETAVASKLAPRIAIAACRDDKQDDIAWALKELLGNVRHAPNQQGLVEVDDYGNVTLINCACGPGLTNAEKHGLGFGVARSLGAIIELRFEQTEYGCYRAITTITWDFDTAVPELDIDIDSITF